MEVMIFFFIISTFLPLFFSLFLFPSDCLFLIPPLFAKKQKEQSGTLLML